MPAIISLQDVVIVMDLPNQEWESFLDVESGEIVLVTDEDRSALEDPEPTLLPESVLAFARTGTHTVRRRSSRSPETGSKRIRSLNR